MNNVNTMEKKPTTAKKKVKKNIVQGQCHIAAGFGNVIVTFTDPSGNTVSWSSAGHMGFKGSRKGTPFAAQVAAEDAATSKGAHMARQTVRLRHARSPCT